MIGRSNLEATSTTGPSANMSLISQERDGLEASRVVGTHGRGNDIEESVLGGADTKERLISRHEVNPTNSSARDMLGTVVAIMVGRR